MIAAPLCECGCGKPTEPARHTTHRLGHVKGQPLRFRRGHKPPFSGSEYVEREGPLVTPCWVWQRAVNSKGYGQRCLADGSGKHVLAHRFHWEREFGRVPVGLELHHVCEETLCVNPDHIVAVTRLQHRRIRRRLSHA